MVSTVKYNDSTGKYNDPTVKYRLYLPVVKCKLGELLYGTQKIWVQISKVMCLETSK